MIQIIDDMILEVSRLTDNSSGTYTLSKFEDRINAFCRQTGIGYHHIDYYPYQTFESKKISVLNVLKMIRVEAQVLANKEIERKEIEKKELARMELEAKLRPVNSPQPNKIKNKSLTSPTNKPETSKSNRIFIVHGHNDKMKLAVARTVEKLGLAAIILHEQPNAGGTIIEKIAKYSNVGFAIVLLSPDDYGYEKGTKPENAKFRARQNVILELGYFLGKLGRNRVVALYMENEKFEMPSDFNGVTYIPFDNADRWQFDLVKELKACGYAIDANKLLS